MVEVVAAVEGYPRYWQHNDSGLVYRVCAFGAQPEFVGAGHKQLLWEPSLTKTEHELLAMPVRRLAYHEAANLVATRDGYDWPLSNLKEH